MAKPIGILGGTFDPVHHGHLRLAIECLERLKLGEVRLIPLHTPPHRAAPHAAPEQRLAMLRMAVRDMPGLTVDDSELSRGDVSYTIDTVAALRERIGEAPACLLMGRDAFMTLNTWRRWESLLDYVHIVIADRVNSESHHVVPELNDMLDAFSVSDAAALHRLPAGKIYRVLMPMLDISATQIRNIIRAGMSAKCLLPDAVVEFINANGLYRDGGE